MNIVFVKYDKPKEYCFVVPEELVPYIKKGMKVLTETMYGLDVGTTTTGVITGEGARDLAINSGAYFPLKPVVSFLDDLLADVVRKEVKDKIHILM